MRSWLFSITVFMLLGGGLFACGVDAPAPAAPPDDPAEVVREEEDPRQRACLEQGNAEACAEGCSDLATWGCVSLGRARWRGQALPIDHITARAELERACVTGDSEGCGLAARAWRFDEDRSGALARAFAFAEQGCEGGDLRACVEVGWHHHLGIARPIDQGHAEALFSSACEEGSPAGCGALGRLRWLVRGDPEGIALITRACEEGEGELCITLAEIGPLEVAQWRGEARALDALSRGCMAGALEACHRKARRLRRGAMLVPIDLESARAARDRACDGGHALACIERADERLGAEGEEAALARLDLDCLRGVVGSCVEHSKRLLMPLAGDAEVTRRALARLETGCEGGSAAACSTLASARLRGWGASSPDVAQALAVLVQRCDRDARDCEALALQLDEGWAIARDPARAFALIQRACVADPGRCGWLDGMSLTAASDASLTRDALSDARRRSCLRDPMRCLVDEAPRSTLEMSCRGGSRFACPHLFARAEREAAGAEQISARLQRSCLIGFDLSCLELLMGQEALQASLGDSCRGGDRVSCAFLVRALVQSGPPSLTEGIAAGGQSFLLEAPELFEHACAQGLHRACFELAQGSHSAPGRRLLSGTEKDLERAQRLYRVACERGSARGCVRWFEASAGSDAAMALLIRACEEWGHAESCRLLLRRAQVNTPCHQGDRQRCRALLKSLSSDVPRLDLSPGRAARLGTLLDASCRLGVDLACRWLGWRWWKVDEDPASAVAPLARGCAFDDMKSCEHLIELCAESIDAALCEEKTLQEARQAMVALGDDSARAALADMSLRAPDPATRRIGAGLLDELCERVGVSFCMTLARALQDGTLPYDAPRAIDLYGRACVDWENATGCDLLMLNAPAWLESRCDDGHARACKQLEGVYRRAMDIGEDDMLFKRARVRLLARCEEADASACKRLADTLYLAHRYVDEIQAREWYERGCMLAAQERVEKTCSGLEHLCLAYSDLASCAILASWHAQGVILEASPSKALTFTSHACGLGWKSPRCAP